MTECRFSKNSCDDCFRHGNECNNDVALTAMAVSTLAPHFSTRYRWLSWLKTYIDKRRLTDILERLRKNCFLAEAAQRNIEDYLIRLLRRDYLRSIRKRTVDQLPDRRTDWAKTYSDSITRTPHQYWSTTPISMNDLRIWQALIGLAEMLLDFRSCLGRPLPETLKTALWEAKIRTGVTLGNSGLECWNWLPSVLRRQARHEWELAAIEEIIKLVSFWLRPFAPEEVNSICRFSGEVLAGYADCKYADNPDHLFEMLCMAAIADAAKRNGWKIIGIEVDVEEQTKGVHPFIVLKNDGPFYCTISKKVPTETQGKIENDYRNILESIGVKAGNMSPDVVCRFYDGNYDKEKPIYFAIADAKRNAIDKHNVYLKNSIQKALFYINYFRNFPGFGSVDANRSPFEMTLFFYSHLKKIAGVDWDKTSSALHVIADILRCESNTYSVIAFDLDSVILSLAGGDSDDNILKTWFRRHADFAQNQHAYATILA